MLIEEEPSAGVPEWVVTFGDMMSLLLTFFIMLVSMSEIRQDERYQGVADSLHQQFGYDTATLSLIPGWARPRETEFKNLTAAGRAKRKEAEGGAANLKGPKGDFPTVRIVRPGTQTAVGTVIFFDDTAVELSTQSQEELLAMSTSVGGKPQKIEIRGHTSPSLKLSAADNWDLAYQRSRNTMRFLVEQMNIDPRRIRMSVAGSNEPLIPDSNATLLRRNSRVEVFLLDETIVEVKSPDAEAEPVSVPNANAETDQQNQSRTPR